MEVIKYMLKFYQSMLMRGFEEKLKKKSCPRPLQTAYSVRYSNFEPKSVHFLINASSTEPILIIHRPEERNLTKFQRVS